MNNHSLGTVMLVLCALLPAGTQAAGAAKPDPLKPRAAWTVPDFGAAKTPPMGWNSWNAFYTDIDEAKVLGAAQALVSTGLRDLGYQFVNIDDGWWLKRRQPDGRMMIRTNLFPSAAVAGSANSSFRPFTDRIHGMGLKAGIYTDVGHNACSQVTPVDNPNLPVGSVDEREVGSMGHVAQDMQLYFGEWGFDYIKVDACGLDSYTAARNPYVANGTYHEFPAIVVNEHLAMTHIPEVQRLYGTVRDAIMKVRPQQDFTFSICSWGTANVRAWGRDYGNLWRTSFDIAATWTRMLHTFDTTVTRELYSGPGHWNDPDMLFIGHGDFDASHLTEARSHFALWAIEDAPLIIGYDLRSAPRELLEILGAPEIIAVNQDPAGNQGVLAFSSDDLQIIVKQLSKRGAKAVAIFNRGLAPITATLTADHLKMNAAQPIEVRDLWARASLGSFTKERDFQVQPRQTLMLKITGTPALANGTYLSEMPARIHVAADGIVALRPDPRVHRMVETWYRKTEGRGSQQVYGGWGGARADATPYDQELSLARKACASGIGALANSRLEVRADAQFKRFTADVGVDDSSEGVAAKLRFEVYGDGRLLVASPDLHYAQGAHHLEANVQGVRVLELIVRQRGADVAPVSAAWGNAALWMP
jgi:hypothetical protein